MGKRDIEDEGDEEDESETVAAVNYKNYSVSPPHTFTTNSPLPDAPDAHSLASQGRWQELLDYYADEDHRPGADALPVEADAALRVARAYCTRKATKIYLPSPYDLTQAQPSTSDSTHPGCLCSHQK